MRRSLSSFVRFQRNPGFQSLLLWRLLALTLTSVATVSFFGARFFGERLRESDARQLRDAALRVRASLSDYMDLHLSAVLALSESLSPAGRPEAMSPTVAVACRGLEKAEKIYPGFLTMLVADARGRIICAIRRGEAGFAGSGASVGDREYFRIPRTTGRTFVSGVFLGRNLGHDAIVALSAPVRNGAGGVIGVVEGSIDIRRLPLEVDGAIGKPVVLVQDGTGAVVYSTHPEAHAALEKWTPLQGESGGGWFPAESRRSAPTKPGQPYDLVERSHGAASDKTVRMTAVRFPLRVPNWQVTAMLPADVIAGDVRQFYWTVGGWLTLVLIVAWFMAWLMARRVAQPVQFIAAAMRAFRFDSPAIAPLPASSAGREIAQIQSEFFRLARRLKESWLELRAALRERDDKNRQLQQLLAELDRKVAERTAQLASSETRYRQVVEHAGDIIYRCDLRGRVTFHNAAFALLFGDDPSVSHNGKRVQDLLHPGDKEKCMAAARRQVKKLIPAIYLEVAIRTAWGSCRWLGQSTQLLLENGKPVGFQAISRDITEQKAAQQALRIAEERYALAVRGSNDGIWDWDLAKGTVYYSPRWKQIIGLTEDVDCRNLDAWLSRVHPDDAASLKKELDAYAATGTGLFENEHRIRHTDGTWRWVSTCGAAVRNPDRRALRIAGSQTDITPGKLADPLSGLPNRLAVLDRLERLFERYQEKPGRDFALLFLDLDRFKLVNDSLGHQVGDELLLGVSRRISVAVRASAAGNSCVGRLGGDEFVVLLDDLPEPETARQVATAILREMEAPFHLAGTFVFASASIGIAYGSGPGSNAEDALQNADAAMYHAKSAGRGQFAVFDGSMHARSIERLRLETDLRNALERQEFLLYYQPQVCLRTGRLTGFEALLRWQRNGRLVGPSEFVPVAEETGLVILLGRWVLEQACRQMAEWRTDFALHQGNFDTVTISVNLSCRQFSDPELTSLIREVLSRTRLPSRALRLEVTETILADDPASAHLILNELAQMGVGLEIDDFGTGYSSLSQLHRLPFDTLKVDRSFVQAMDKASEGRKIIDSIASLAGSLGISVVAEGIETPEHWTQLESMGCHVGQGYFFGVPSDAEETAKTIRLRCRQTWEKPDGSLRFANDLQAIGMAAALGEKMAEPRGMPLQPG